MTVKQKQCLLAFLGYYVGEIDGIWGTLSKTATKAFQQDHGLKVDGIFGEATGKAARTAVANYENKKATTTTPVKDSGSFWDEITYFDRSEFACHCGGKYCNGFPAEPQEKLIRVADRARKALGGAATVSSGVRCSRHNSSVGGVSHSRHLQGKAMDFCIAGKTAEQVLAYVQQQPEIRYAYSIDSTFVHMDIE